MDRWCVSNDGECFRGRFNKKEDAVLEAKKATENKAFVGKCKKIDISIDGEFIVDYLKEKISSELGDIANNFLSEVKSKELCSLGDEITLVLKKWISKNNIDIDCIYSVVDIEKVR